MQQQVGDLGSQGVPGAASRNRVSGPWVSDWTDQDKLNRVPDTGLDRHSIFLQE